MSKKSMMKEYFDNVKYYENKYGNNTILLWQCGSFFEVYGLKDNEGNITGSNIFEFAKILEIIIAEKKSFINYDGERKKIVMAGNGTVVPLEKYIPKLNNAGYTVVVWNEVGDDHINGGKERKELGVFSVGTNFDIQTKEITNNIACIWIESFKKSIIQKLPRIFFGCSTIDIYTGKVTLFQYKYEANKLHEPCVFDELERFMSIYNPRELILIHNYEDDKKIKELLQFIEYSDIKLHSINLNKKNDKTIQALKCEKQIWQQEILTKFYKMNDFNVFFDSCRLKEYSWATQSFVYLLNFVEKHNINLVENLNQPEYDKTDDKVFLATHSLKQLNIISQNQKSKLSSLEKFLNNCYTNMGKRIFRYHILHPNFDEKYLMKEYEIIDYILNKYESLEIIRKQLNSIKDIEKLERKIILNKINPCEIVEIYSNTKTLIKIMNIIQKNDILNNYVTEKICDNFIETCNKVTQFLEKYINFEEAINIIKIKEPINFFKKNIFKHLDTIHREHIENEQKLLAIQHYLSSILEKNEKKKLISVKSFIKKHQTPKSGLWLQATSKRSEILKIYINQLPKKNIKLSYNSNYDQSVKEFDVSLENFKCVTTSQNNKKIQSITLNELYDSILQSSHILFEIIEQSYNQFIKELKNYSKELNTVIKFTGLVDFIMTKTYNAREYNYCKPVIDGKAEKSYFDAKAIRHPLIEHINRDELYKPNDISLGDNIDGTLLYGTNAVGKSSLIKSIGMSIIMAQAGMYVPCNSFLYKPYKIISTRILGNDNFFKGLSSFAVEMSELKTILNIADENTLILGDELCSGTEIKSALSIFAASLITLSERKSSFIFATHLHELQRLDKIKSINTMNMKHMRVEYDPVKDKLIYMRDLRDGAGNNMYGLEVCKSLGLKDNFIELANDIRYNLFPKEKTSLDNNPSNYNAKKIKNNCEFCDNFGEEVHHLNPQEFADNLGNIFHFKKNHKANLVNICKECHKKITKKKIIHRITKTSSGYELIEQ